MEDPNRAYSAGLSREHLATRGEDSNYKVYAAFATTLANGTRLVTSPHFLYVRQQRMDFGRVGRIPIGAQPGDLLSGLGGWADGIERFTQAYISPTFDRFSPERGDLESEWDRAKPESRTLALELHKLRADYPNINDMEIPELFPVSERLWVRDVTRALPKLTAGTVARAVPSLGNSAQFNDRVGAEVFAAEAETLRAERRFDSSPMRELGLELVGGVRGHLGTAQARGFLDGYPDRISRYEELEERLSVLVGQSPRGKSLTKPKSNRELKRQREKLTGVRW